MAKTKDEPKATLPVNHPEAGYVSPDLSYHEGTGIIPDAEVEWHEDRNQAREEEIERVADGEDKAAKEEQKRREKLAEEMGSKIPVKRVYVDRDEVSTSDTSTAVKSEKTSERSA